MENKAKTTVTGSARMPDVEDVGEKGMEGAKKTLGAVIDGMMPVLAKGPRARVGVIVTMKTKGGNPTITTTTATRKKKRPMPEIFFDQSCTNYIIELVFLRFLRSPLKRKHGKIWIKI